MRMQKIMNNEETDDNDHNENMIKIVLMRHRPT